MFDDLKAAILAILEDSCPCVPDGIDSRVKTELLYTLQAEFNIHFIEPEADQCNQITQS